MANKIIEETKQKMEKALAAFRQELSKQRTGRASLSILENVKAEMYGSHMPLNQLATLSVPDARTIVIQPWDMSAAPAIERAIQTSALGLNPVNDGKVIRLNLPSLTEERRKEMVKVIKRQAEECKVTLRTIRRDANEEIKKLKKDVKITEDEERQGMEKIQKLTDEVAAKIDESVVHKEKDIMEV